MLFLPNSALSYLKSQVLHLHRLAPQTVADDIYAVLRLYERELLSRGLKLVSTSDGEMTFRPVARESVYLD